MESTLRARFRAVRWMTGWMIGPPTVPVAVSKAGDGLREVPQARPGETPVAGAVTFVLCVAFLAGFVLRFVFRMRDQPAAEAWTFAFALASGVGFLLLLRLNGVVALNQTFWVVAMTLTAIGASIEAATSASAWTRSGRIATAVLLAVLAFLAWRWMQDAPRTSGELRKGEFPRDPSTSHQLMADRSGQRTPKGAYVPPASFRTLVDKLRRAFRRKRRPRPR
jgi:hypothetical protein